MKLDCIIYTTNKKLWVERDFGEIYSTLKRATGVEVVPFTVKYKKLPSNVPTYTETDGGVYIDWVWIKEHYPALGRNAVCLHISTEERARLGLKHPTAGSALGGAYRVDDDNIFDFVVIADEYGMALYGGLTAFTRIFLHELSHGFSQWRSVKDMTHTYDYTLRDIQGIYSTHSFEMWNKLVSQLATITLQIKLLMQGKQLEQPNSYPEPQKTNAERLYETALSLIGTDASPRDMAPDELGCAETVSTILGKVIQFPVLTGTWSLFDKLRTDKRFEKIGAHERGAIIISYTGSGNGKFPGHTGICGKGTQIMSNSSATGQFTQNYTDSTWKERYMRKGGFPVHYFRLKG